MAMKAAVIGDPMLPPETMVLVVNVDPMTIVRPVRGAPLPIGLSLPDRPKVPITTRRRTRPKPFKSLSLAPGEPVSWSQPTRSPGCSNEGLSGYDCADQSSRRAAGYLSAGTFVCEVRQGSKNWHGSM
jgi:hypothetical protein